MRVTQKPSRNTWNMHAIWDSRRNLEVVATQTWQLKQLGGRVFSWKDPRWSNVLTGWWLLSNTFVIFTPILGEMIQFFLWPGGVWRVWNRFGGKEGKMWHVGMLAGRFLNLCCLILKEKCGQNSPFMWYSIDDHFCWMHPNKNINWGTMLVTLGELKGPDPPCFAAGNRGNLSGNGRP